MVDAYNLAAIILTLAVLIGYLNHLFIKLQPTIAIMSGALILCLVLLVFEQLGFSHLKSNTSELLLRTNFHSLLLNGMLSFLLFAGSLTVDINSLKRYKWEIATLASLSTIASTALISIALHWLLPFINIHLPWIYCMLFGALISPTDPIAVLATFKELGAPKSLEVCVAGESLFNDGVGIVIFISLYQLLSNTHHISAGQVSVLFIQETLGGIGYGVILGAMAIWLIKPIEDHKIIILITLAIVTGGYAFAQTIEISGPLAMVVTGLMVGGQLHNHKFSPKSTMAIDTFWEIIDEILNAVLFLLVGFELLAIDVSGWQLLAALLVIPLVLIVRFVTVGIPMHFFKSRNLHSPYTISLLTWGGLRGGLAVALALSLPLSDNRNFILALTYAVVSFAIIVQGLSIKPFLKKIKSSQ